MTFPIGDFQFHSAAAVILVLCLFLVAVVGYDLRNLPHHFRCNIRWIAFSAALVTAAAAGGLLGVTLLAYPSLAVCAISAVAAIALGYYRNPKAPVSSVVGKVGVFLIAFVLPMALWISVINWMAERAFIFPRRSQFSRVYLDSR